MHSPVGPLLSFALLIGAMNAGPHQVSVEAVCFPAALRGEYFSYRLTEPVHTASRELALADAEDHVRTALSGCGLFEAPAGVAPDLVIAVACGVGPAEARLRTRTVPLDEPSMQNPFLGTATSRYVTVTERVRVVPKYLVLSAQQSGTHHPVWRVHVSVTGEALAIEPVLPVLAAAAMNIIGRNTQGTTTLRLSSTDADVLFIRAGMDQAGPAVPTRRLAGPPTPRSSPASRP